MRTWYIYEMLKEEPCEDYTLDVLEDLWCDRETVNILDILDFDIPAAHKVWGASLSYAIDKEDQNKWMAMVVTRAIEAHKHVGSMDYRIWAEKWLKGEHKRFSVNSSTGPVVYHTVMAAKYFLSYVNLDCCVFPLFNQAANSYFLQDEEYERQLVDLRKTLGLS